MWLWKLILVALEFLLYMVTVSEAWCTCRFCWHCTGCSATQCSRIGRALSLLDYLAIYDQEVNRRVQASPVIPCSIPNKMCDFPYNKYCCALQSDGSLSCGLGEGWSTCVAGSALVNNIITPIYTKSQCDFDFPCTGNGGNDCCGGLDLYNGEGAGTCSSSYCTSSALQIVACNYVGSSASQFKTPDFDATLMVDGVMPTQVSNKYCGENNISNRNSGRCRASNLCCSPLGLCGETPESCATRSVSWVWMSGSINNWVQTGGAADSSIPCGNGTIGNGRCPTAADGSDYGIQCCSDSGMCGSSYCNGADGNDYTCSCAHGTPGRGTRGCKTCASCNEGYYMSSSNANTCSPIKIGEFNCASGFFTYIDLWFDSPSGFVTGIDFFTCSDGSKVDVYKGQHTGGHKSTPTQTSGYCGGKVGSVYRPSGTKNQYTTQLSVVSCDTVTTTFGGPISGEINPTLDYGSSQGGKQLTGMQAATCENGGLNNMCFLSFIFTTVQIVPTPVPSTKKPTAASATAVSCDSGKFITKISLSAGSYVNGITSITCSSDRVPLQVSTGLTGTSYTAISGDGTSSSLGYCSYKSGLSSSFVTQLKFIECSGTVDGTYGTTSATTTTVKCPTGQRAVGITISTSQGSLRSFAFVCDIITRNVLCGSGKYITQIILRSSDVVYGISSITCSDGSSKEVNTGLVGGAQSRASSSRGYCTYSTGLSGSLITQFTLGECTTSATDGPYGTNSATVTGHGCPSGKMAIGLKTSTGTALTSFSFACATISTAAPTPVPTQTPTKTIKPTVAPSGPTGNCSCPHGVGDVGVAGCTTCISCRSGYALEADTYLCVPTTVVKCPTGTFITELQMKWYGSGTDWVDGITSMTCWGGSTVSVNAGGTNTPDISFTATAGDGSSSSPGYCASSEVYNVQGASQLKLTECAGGVVDGPYGTEAPTAGISVTKTCGIGERAIGVATTISPVSMAFELLYFSIVCGPITVAPSAAPKTIKPTVAPSAASTTGICPCLSGESGCTTCVSCVGPYQLFNGHCALWFRCADGQFVTKITLSYGDWVYGISTLTCSDGEVITVNLGTTDAPFQVTASSGNGSSSSPGYCAYSADYNGDYVSQLKLIECGAIESDGPYGAIETIPGKYGTCPTGTRAGGLYISGIPGSSVTYFEYGCA